MDAEEVGSDRRLHTALLLQVDGHAGDEPHQLAVGGGGAVQLGEGPRRGQRPEQERRAVLRVLLAAHVVAAQEAGEAGEVGVAPDVERDPLQPGRERSRAGHSIIQRHSIIAARDVAKLFVRYSQAAVYFDYGKHQDCKCRLKEAAGALK